MSGGLDVLALKEEDVTKFLACNAHQGSTNVDFQMMQYVFKRKPDGEYASLCCRWNESVIFQEFTIAQVASFSIIQDINYSEMQALWTDTCTPYIQEYTAAFIGSFTPWRPLSMC